MIDRIKFIKNTIMKRIVTISTLIILSYYVNAQFSQTFKADTNPQAEEEITQLEYYLASLLEKNDALTYSGYLTEDYIRIGQNGLISTKEEVLSSMKNNKTGLKMMPHDLKVRVYGNTAILNGSLDVEKKSGESTIKTSSLFTKVFIKRDGKWYLASLQGTPLNE
jgi:ketosteroid isomerase-like protein